MSAVPQATPSVKIFFSYSHDDEELRRKLHDHLSEVWRRGVAGWSDRQIGPGTEWDRQIDARLDSAHIILLLISSSFLASRYCYDIEMKRALARHANREAIVIPILLRPVARWRKSPFWKLQSLPPGGKPVTAWEDVDQALAATAEQISDIVDKLLGDAEPATVWPRLDVQARRHPIRWIGTAVAVAAVSLGLIVFGIRERLPRGSPAPVAQAAGLSNQQRLNLAFAAGSAIAMAGQSSTDAGNQVFHRALSGLGFGAESLRDLDGRYGGLARAAHAGNATYDDFEDAKLQLVRRVSASLAPNDAAAAAFAHDLTALRLLLRYWQRYQPGDALHAANDRVNRLRRSARGVALPTDIAQRIEALDDVNLVQTAYRTQTEQMLDAAMVRFDRVPVE